MGTYVNPGFDNFNSSRKNKFYVDKSMLIALLNEKIGTDDRFLCVSRPRRFGKTMAANMIAAYYSKGCDSHEIFSDLKISKDPSYEENINKYAVIQLDMNDVVTNKGSLSVSEYINRVVVAELRDEYQNIDLEDGITLSNSLKRINLLTHDQFVFVIDEYDVVIRDEEYSKDFNDYLKLLVSLFNSSSTAPAIALAYLTGILPIIKDKTDSGLNNFTEYTMLDADEMAPFMGFTEDEVKSLSTQSGMEFYELKKWYDGYNLNEIEIYSPKSVINSVEKSRCDDYWTQTKSYKALKDYILMDFYGIKNDVISMISGEHIPVNVKKFTNTSFIDSKDDAFTSLIHLGYLGYNYSEKTCFIPNYELLQEWIIAIEDTPDYKGVVELIRDSKKLLEATWNGDEEAVAEGVGKAHMEACSILEYNNEGSFQSAIHFA